MTPPAGVSVTGWSQRTLTRAAMWLDGVHISTSVATYELTADGPDRTSLRYTEQGTHLDGLDDPAGREQGMSATRADTAAAATAAWRTTRERVSISRR